MESIQDYWTRIKALLNVGVSEWGIAILVILVGFACFGLGRLSALVEKSPIAVVKTASAAQALTAGGMYIGSKIAGSYYFPWCSQAERIAPEDRAWFESEAAAQAAGYKPAKGCKGLDTASGN